jgi:hypothetical protein
MATVQNGTGVLCAKEERMHAPHNYQRRIGVPDYRGIGLTCKETARPLCRGCDGAGPTP